MRKVHVQTDFVGFVMMMMMMIAKQLCGISIDTVSRSDIVGFGSCC
jgi:hypothetical protein